MPEMPEGTEQESLQARIHKALEATCGNRIDAAAALGISLETLKNKIFASPDLRARWSQDEAEAPSDIDALSREHISVDSEKLARAYEIESRKFRENLENLPLSDKEREIALQLQKLNQGSFKELLDIANASMGLMVPKLISRVQQIEGRLAVVTKALVEMGTDMDEERVYLAQEEKGLGETYIQTVDMVRKIQQASFEGSKTIAIIRARLQNGKTKNAKPAFQEIDKGGAITI